jgi:hypothetical protein
MDNFISGNATGALYRVLYVIGSLIAFWEDCIERLIC